MPVHFKGSSEYKTHFKWMDSFRSKSFQPSEEQAANSAGQASVCASLTVEPPLQHKKRLEGPPTSLSTNYFSVPSKEVDYALLGQQEKFAPNVRYKPKPGYAGQKIYKNKENFDDAPPPSKQLKMQKRIKPLFKERHPRVSRSPPRQPSTSTLLSPPPAPREPKDSLDIKEALKDKDLKDVLGDSAPAKEAVVAKPVREVASDLEKGRGNNMNEYVQTNMKKGVALSAPEAPAEYALKYKAGVAPPRPVKKFSEYQRQFMWKDGMKASPLLAAEQIVYKSNAELGPYKTEAIPKQSEYSRQFQEWKLPEYAADINFNLNDTKTSGDGQLKQKKKKTAMKRSKSAGAVLRQEPEEVEDEAAVEVPESEEQLKEKLKKSHGKIKRLGSEYKANFKSPLRYSYAEGAWRGAAPPQMIPQASSAENTDANNNNNDKAAAEDTQPLSNWFAEVLELRRRAAEYRKRAQGTHFSREHLVQLMAKQAECWDLNSEGSSTVRALNLEAPTASLRAKVKYMSADAPSHPVDALSHEATEGDSPQLSDVEDLEPERKEGKKKKGRKGGKGKASRKSRKMAWLEEQKEKVADQRRQLEEIRQRDDAKNDDDDGDNGEGEIGKEGRLPTPLLQGDGSARRHHLDLTTPAVGGALLTCPPSKGSKLIITSRSGDSYVTASDDLPVKGQHKSYNVDKLLTLPAGGKPSLDTHALRDDAVESDRALVTQYVMSPPLPGSEEDKENKGQKKKKSSKVPKPSNLSTIKEGYGKTYQPFLNLDDIKASTLDNKKDDDVLSTSLMSVASSSSLASEVLERAKKRQEFWGKKHA